MIDQELSPHNEDAELCVVGACLIDPDAIPRVVSIIRPADFYKPQLRAIWKAMVALHERNEPVDVLTVSDEMGGDEIPLLTELTNQVPTSIHAEHYAKMVEKTATRRRLLDASGQIAKAAVDESKTPDEIRELSLRLILETDSHAGGNVRSLSELMRAYYDRIEALARTDKVLGLPTGYRDLDTILGGFERSDLIILAARPRVGKTSLALCITRNVAALGGRVLFFSLEMSHDQVIRRLTAMESEVGISSLKTGKLLESEWPAFMRTVDTFDSLPILVDDQPAITPSYLRAEAMKAEATVGPLDLIVVDYLQLMRPDRRHSSRREDVTAIGQALKGLAKPKGLNVPILALSQLNRVSETRSDKRPQLHDLRESGDLEQTANTVILLYRDELNDPDAAPGLTEVIVAKNRDGTEGVAHLLFQSHLARFVSADITREVL